MPGLIQWHLWMQSCEYKYLVNVTKDGLLDGIVLDNFSENTTVSTPDDKHLLWVWVGVHGKMSDHLLVAECEESHQLIFGTTDNIYIRELVPLSCLDNIVQN